MPPKPTPGTHGLTYHFIYKRWASIKSRCFAKKGKNYHNYPGRGIKMFPLWINDVKAFYDYVKTLPKYKFVRKLKLSIDRINNDGDYEPGNIRWATIIEQNNNQRKKKCKNTTKLN